MTDLIDLQVSKVLGLDWRRTRLTLPNPYMHTCTACHLRLPSLDILDKTSSSQAHLPPSVMYRALFAYLPTYLTLASPTRYLDPPFPDIAAQIESASIGFEHPHS